MKVGFKIYSTAYILKSHDIKPHKCFQLWKNCKSSY